MVEKDIDCGRPGCTESFVSEIGRDQHIARDHDSRREEIDNYPRAPEER